MTASIPFNYLPTTVAAGSFNAQSVGYVQGTFIDDPAIRYQLKGGVLATTETLPMWGGVAINETVGPNVGGPDGALGGLITRATNVTAGAAGQITGFSVFAQAYGMAITPQSSVPLAPSSGQVNFFRLGSNARLFVLCSPALASLEGGSITQPVSWDYNGQQLVPYIAAYPANVITAASWAATSGGQVTFITTTNHGVAVGDYFSISGMTPAGYNGDFVAIAGTATDVLVAALATNPGAETILGTLVAGGGALPCKVEEILAGNSMVVDYNPATGLASWQYNGTVAVIQI